MDFSQFIKEPDKKAKSLVRKLAHSGETDLNKDELHELKQICKNNNNEFMIVVYKECIKCLHKDHSQVRVATVKLLDYLFRKSHVIREKLLYDCNLFLELTLAITEKPKVKLRLPPPKKYAALLQELTAKVIHKWHADFGTGYEKLRYAHKYLKEHKLVDFSQFQVHTHEQLINQQRLAERQEKILTRSIENRLKELRELKPEIEQLLAQIESLIDILVPNDDNLMNEPSNGTNDLEDDEESAANQQQQHGIANLSSTINIEFSPYLEVRKCADNREIVKNLKELKKELICSKLVKLVAIEKTLCKRSDQLVNTIREIIDLKTRSTNIVLKLGELKIVNEPSDELNESRKSTRGETEFSESDESDGDDFQDVEPKEDFEAYIPKSMRYEYGLEPIDPRELDSTNRVRLVEESFCDDKVPGPSRCDTEPTLTISCNVRLESGKLCTRRDKIKCPFHGKIIPRDHNGIPLDENARRREEEEAKKRPKIPDWQDPQLLSEIKAATGVDLTMPSKGRVKGSPRKNLANTKTCDTTPQQRLKKRLKLLIK